MNSKINYTMKDHYLNNNKTQREKKNIYENIIHNSSFKAKLNNQFNKNDKPILLNNQNHIKSINIINNNYNNIIINNKLTPNKKVLIDDKAFSINKKNYKILTLGNKQNVNLDRSKGLKLDIDNQGQEKDYKYKLLLNEKNNLIHNLKNEVAYYKNRKKNKSPTITNNNNTINIDLNNKKNFELENIRNKIQNIFPHHKKDLKLDTNNIFNHNINNYHTIKTYAYNNNSSTNNVGSPKKDVIPQIYQNKPFDINKTNNYKNNNTLMFNYSLKNDLKLKNNKLTLDLNNNYNSIEANTNRIYKYTIKSPKLTFTLNAINKNKGNYLDLNNNSNNYNAITYEEKNERNTSLQNLKKRNVCYNGFSPSQFSLKKQRINKIIYDNNDNLDSFIDEESNNNIPSPYFNYKDNFENLKNRMTDLIENLFDLIELQRNKNK